MSTTGAAIRRPVRSFDLAVEEGEVEAGVVRHDRRIAGEREQASYGDVGARRAPQRLGANPGDRRDGRRERDPRVDECLESVLELERPDPLRADLADA